MKTIRELVYSLGFRPDPKSIFFSPILCVIYYFEDAKKYRKIREDMIVLAAIDPNIRELLLKVAKDRRIYETD